MRNAGFIAPWLALIIVMAELMLLAILVFSLGSQPEPSIDPLPSEMISNYGVVEVK